MDHTCCPLKPSSGGTSEMAGSNMSLKVMFLVHLSLTVGASYQLWLPSIYRFYNGALLLCILWSLHASHSEDPAFVGASVSGLCVLFDILTFVFAWPLQPFSARWFSMLCALANLFLRPATCFLLHRLLQERNAAFGGYSVPPSRGRYEDLDRSQARSGQTTAEP